MATGKKIAIFLPGFVISLLGVWFAQYYLITQDAAYFLTVADRILQSGYDIIEPNTPLTGYINLIPVILAKYLNFSTINCFFAFCFVLLQVQLVLCYFYIRKNPLLNSPFKAMAIVSCLYVMLFVMPNAYIDFGQREHLFLALVLAYIFSCLNRLLNIKEDNKKIILLTAIFAGIGMAIKPYFIVLLFMSELFMAINKKDPFYWRRIEVITIIVTISVLYVFMFSVYPEYFTTLLPRIADVYQNIYTPLPEVLKSVIGIITLPVIGLFFFLRAEKEKLLVLAFVIFTIFVLCFIVLLQSSDWSYKLYPGRALSLLFLCLCGIFAQKKAAYILLIIYAAYLYFYFDAFNLLKFENNRKYTLALAEFIKKEAPNESVIYFETYLSPSFSAINYANAKWPLRMASLIYLPYAYSYECGTAIKYNRPDKMDKTEKLFFNTVIEDVVNNPPKLMMFKPYKACRSNFFDHIYYFSQDNRFAAIFKKYKIVENNFDLKIFELEN